MQTFKRHGLVEVHFHDDLFGQNGKARGIADRCRGNDPATLGYGKRFNDGIINGADLVRAQLLDGFGKMLVDEHHFAAIDGGPQGSVDLKWHAPRKHMGFGEQLVDIVTKRCAGNQRDLERVGRSARSHGHRHGLGIASAGETAHADHHAVFNQARGLLRGNDLVPKRSVANTCFQHL